MEMKTCFEDLIVRIPKVKADHNFEIRHKSYSFLNLFWKIIIRHPCGQAVSFLCVAMTTCVGVSSFNFCELDRKNII
jgi:hypothetical protein